jgi:hypothetical protein
MIMTAVETDRVLLLTGRSLSSADYRGIEDAIGAGLYIATGAGDALEQLIGTSFAAIVVVEGFGLMKLPRLLAAIRLQHKHTPVLVLGSPPAEESELFIRQYRPVEFLPVDMPLSELCRRLRSVLAGVPYSARERNPNAPETPILEWISGRRSESETEKSLQLTREVLRQVLHSSSQGLGIGSLITYFELLEATAERQDGKIIISEDTFAAIAQNVGASRQWLENLERALQALTNGISAEVQAGDSLIAAIQEVLAAVQGEAQIRRHFIAADFGDGNFNVSASAEIFSQVVQEIILNALKYSPEGSAIRLSAGRQGGYFELRAENRMAKAPEDGDAANLKKPFIRLSNTIDDRYRLNYGLGLGLTISEFRIRQMGGTLDVRREAEKERDMADAEAQKLIIRVRLPVL